MFRHNNRWRVSFGTLLAVALAGGALAALHRSAAPCGLPAVHLASALPVDVFRPSTAIDTVTLLLTATALRFFRHGG